MLGFDHDHNGVPILRYRDLRMSVILAVCGSVILLCVMFLVPVGDLLRHPSTPALVLYGGGAALLVAAGMFAYRQRIIAADSDGYLVPYRGREYDERLRAYRRFRADPRPVLVLYEEVFLFMRVFPCAFRLRLEPPTPAGRASSVALRFSRRGAERLAERIRAHFLPPAEP